MFTIRKINKRKDLKKFVRFPTELYKDNPNYIGKRISKKEDDLLDYYAIGQCTPGIIAVNVSTFVGYKKRGIIGAIFSTLGMISPSLIIVSIIALFLSGFMSNPYVAHAVGGIKIVVCALMLNTVITMGKKTIKNVLGAVICILAFLIAMLTPVPTVAIVIVAGVLGVLLTKFDKREESR